MPDDTRAAVVRRLAQESFSFDITARDAERNSWMVVHRYTHGILPSEYDIREIDEKLYLDVLDLRKELDREQHSG